MKKEEYFRIRNLFAETGIMDVHPKQGGKFYFPIYLTAKLENTGIDALELGVRSYNCLKRAGINTIGELCNRIYEHNDLHTIRNCGKTSVIEIMDCLFAYHYEQLKPEMRGKYLADVVERNMNK